MTLPRFSHIASLSGLLLLSGFGCQLPSDDVDQSNTNAPTAETTETTRTVIDEDTVLMDLRKQNVAVASEIINGNADTEYNKVVELDDDNMLIEMRGLSYPDSEVLFLRMTLTTQKKYNECGDLLADVTYEPRSTTINIRGVGVPRVCVSTNMTNEPAERETVIELPITTTSHTLNIEMNGVVDVYTMNITEDAIRFESTEGEVSSVVYPETMTEFLMITGFVDPDEGKLE